MARLVPLLCVLAACVAPSAGAAAQDAPAIPGLSTWADAVTADGVWTGPRIAYPEPTPRPPAAGRSRASLLFPVAVHAETAALDARTALALAALESAYERLVAEGWPAPPPDGGRDGTDGFDLHLRAAHATLDAPSWVPSERAPPERFARAGLDAPDLLSDVDGALTFAEVYAGVSDDRLEACVTAALVEAALLAADPAEAPSVRRATATFLAWTWTGHFGCDDEPVILAQREPTRAYLGHDPSTGEGGALLLSALCERHDGGTGAWLRDVWNAARQRSARVGPSGVGATAAGGTGASAGGSSAGLELHALPDLPWMLVMATELTRTPLLRTVVDLAASRWFAGSRRAGARLAILRALPDEATPQAWIETSWARLPRRLLFGEREVEPYGTAYALVDVRAAPAGSRLQVWMEGEYGVEWSLVGMRVGRDGREIGRTRAPPRERDPRSYLSIELLEDTAEVVLAVTNLSGRGPDADEPDEHGRSFRLTVDRESD